MGIPCSHIIQRRLERLEAILPSDFHPHWHINRPPIGTEWRATSPPILNPRTRIVRRNEEAERRAHIRANQRIRTAQTGRILSQDQQGIRTIAHCSLCVTFGHDKVACRGCKSTGHTRRNCPENQGYGGSQLMATGLWEQSQVFYEDIDVVPATQF